ncbi:MAG: BREX-1 system adenine-specific DNA-methyltransferase PglX [Saccharospirillaceae bacterium]|nr:BREX-1 system adenine-specific DNA-methyltransferase PglX [Pseudomonadales bacterium]NRB78691.1 BREX-1 system adenine-specific DNA-methyltransferase PglX [Saccharospirillaceae bacterium]
MKLSDHVDKIRILITASFDKQFSTLCIGANKQSDLEKLPEQVRAKRNHLEVMLENHIGETGCYQDAREKLLDELSFTLFNRLAAIKVMESANLFPPVITKQAEHGGRSFGHKVWLEEYPEKCESELEGIRDYFKFAFNELADSLPLYSKEYPYALLPDAISLNEIIEAFNAIEGDSQVDDDIWHSDDVLGWLYESYNNAKKQAFKESKALTEYDKVSLQSQVYTPRWVVQFLVENSLGKLYLEMYPESDIKNQFKIINAPKIQERDHKPLHEIKLIDPASGSGNFLLYAFDVFYELYIDQIENYDAEYDEDEIPKLIIENNLHGIDLDDRAIQLAQLGLYIKARKKRRFIKGSFNFNVISSDFYLPEYDEARHIFEVSGNLDRTQKELIEDIWNDLRYAYKFGSLIRLDEKLKAKLKELENKQGDKILDMFADADIREQKDFTELFFKNLMAAVEQFSSKGVDNFIASKTRDAIVFLELLTTEYDIACANPPYTYRREYGSDLKEFIDKNYRKPFDTYINLYSCFIQRIDQLLTQNGKMAMVTPMTFMFISTFQETRKLILTKYFIDTFVQFGFGGMFNESVDPAMFVLSKGEVRSDSTFFKLDQYFTDNKKFIFNDAIVDLMEGKVNEHIYHLNQSKLLEIVANPFIFWISQNFRDKFRESLLESSVKVCGGLTTGKNERFLRFWWELASSNEDISKDWVSYAKGGTFNKWKGNLWVKINWKNNGFEIKNFFGDNGKRRSVIRNEEFYFQEGITYSASGRGGYAFRQLPEGNIFDAGGSCMFPVKSFKNFKYLLALLNSKLVFYIADCLNPTANLQVGDLQRVPFVKPDKNNEELVSELSEDNVKLTSLNLKTKVVETDFECTVFSPQSSWLDSIKVRLVNYCFEQALILINEAIINECIFDVYALSESDRNLVNLKEGVDVGLYYLSNEAKSLFIDKYSHLASKFALETVINIPDRDSIIDTIEIEKSLARNIDVKFICMKHEINPLDLLLIVERISLKKLPKSYSDELLMEFFIDLIRDILLEDEDGIIPIVPNAGEKILQERVEDKFREKGFSTAQYSNFEKVLGSSINNYIHKQFFSGLTEYLNMFSYLPKTPFIWHITSGSEQGFSCYISIYKWNRDNLLRLRSIYVENRERALMNRQSDLANNESIDAQNEKDKIFKQLKEIETFKVKIDELLEEGYAPIIDDGVGKNIAPLQQKKMLAYDVLKAAQLKKYLNADW